MKMHDVEVSIVNGEVVIGQENFPNDDQIIVVAPHQVEILCQWLKEAAIVAKEG